MIRPMPIKSCWISAFSTTKASVGIHVNVLHEMDREVQGKWRFLSESTLEYKAIQCNTPATSVIMHYHMNSVNIMKPRYTFSQPAHGRSDGQITVPWPGGPIMVCKFYHSMQSVGSSVLTQSYTPSISAPTGPTAPPGQRGSRAIQVRFAYFHPSV